MGREGREEGVWEVIREVSGQGVEKGEGKEGNG